MDYDAIYQRALNEVAFRQEFLNKIDLKENVQFVSKLIYKNKKKQEAVMECRTGAFAGIFQSKHRRSRIIVYANAFDPLIHQTFEDFYSNIMHHEAFHARQTYYNENGELAEPFFHSRDAYSLWRYEIELQAYENQYKFLNNRNSPAYKDAVWKRKATYSALVSGLKRRLGLQ